MTRIRALLADDHAVVRAGIRDALSKLPDLDVVGEVSDGPSVFDALEALAPDILLIDVTMPEFEPISAVHRIRDQYPEMKILVVSAYDDNVYVQGLLGAGVDGYHLKDQPLSDLRLAVERVLSGKRWVSGSLVDKLVNLPEQHAPQAKLTDRQRDILCLLQEGLDNRTIARRLGLSVKTVENHLTRLYRRLDVQSRLEAVNYAMCHPDVLALPADAVTESDTDENLTSTDALSVLLVDDNVRYRRQLRRMIGQVSSRVMIYEAEDVVEAARLAEQVAPDLALVDVILCDEDGITCTRRVKACSPESRVVLISAYPDREFHRQGLAAGAVAFVDKKDLDAAALREIIEDATV